MATCAIIGKNTDEKRTAITRVHRGIRGIPALRCSSEFCSGGPALHACSPRTRLPQKSGDKSEPARAEAKDQAFRFPRPWRREYLEDFSFGCLLSRFADQILVHEALADDLRNSKIESVPVSHVSPIVVTKSLFIDVPKQVERFNGYVGTLEGPLEKAPEVFQPVSVNHAVNVCFGVVDDLVRKFLIQAPIGDQFVGVNVRSLADVLLNDGLKGVLLTVLNYRRSNFAAALEHSDHDGLLERVVFPFGRVHVPCLAADEGFVHFDVTSQFSAALALVRLSDPVEHEPRGLLTDTERPVEFPGRDAILGISEEPHSREPLVQAKRRVFKDSASLDRELALGVMASTLPALMLRHETDTLTSAGGAYDAVGPALRGEIVQAVLGVGVVYDGFLKSGGRLAFHALTIAENRGLVKFIIAIPGAK